MADVPKRQLYRELGYGGDAGLYDQVLDDAGLSGRHKSAIDQRKREEVDRLLGKLFLKVCNRGDCRQRANKAAVARRVVPASDPKFCEICGGQAQSASVDSMVVACKDSGIGRICIVGGAPEGQTVLRRLVANRLELRFVHGTRARNLHEAKADQRWADLIVLWGNTPLDHRVSNLYEGKDVVNCARRGVGEIAGEIERAARRRARL